MRAGSFGYYAPALLGTRLVIVVLDNGLHVSTISDDVLVLTLRERECPPAESASSSLETKYEIDDDSAHGHLPLPKG